MRHIIYVKLNVDQFAWGIPQREEEDEEDDDDDDDEGAKKDEFDEELGYKFKLYLSNSMSSSPISLQSSSCVYTEFIPELLTFIPLLGAELFTSLPISGLIGCV